MLLGYSDTTMLHLAYQRAGVVSFYGPAIMAGFAENGGMHPYLVDGVRRTLFEGGDTVWPENEDGWTVEHLDWSDPSNQTRRRQLRPTEGWRWSRDHTPVTGRSVVVCFELLEMARGTRWWPDLDRAVLVLETSEDAPAPDHLLYAVRSWDAMGELDGLAAIVLGRPGGADLDPADHGAYDEALRRGLTEAGREDLLVVTGADVGHTDPMWTLPIGVDTTLDPAHRRVTLASGVT